MCGRINSLRGIDMVDYYTGVVNTSLGTRQFIRMRQIKHGNAQMYFQSLRIKTQNLATSLPRSIQGIHYKYLNLTVWLVPYS